MLNEGETKRRNKAKKNKLIPARPNFPEGQASDDTTPAENPHGTNSMGSEEIGHKRGGKKAKGVKAPSPGKLFRVVRRTKSKEGKRTRAKEVMSKNTAGPVGRLPDHTVYHDMGYLMAESLGLISEYNSRDELRRELGGRGIATFNADGTGPARDVSPGEKPKASKPKPKAPEPKPKAKKKVVIRKKKTKPPSARSIAKRWHGPDGSEHGG
ncbi:MAG: hypothetical protein CMJ25_03030 [Phycisphaerae bacterium]|nr:hypothetical protein [Phycisphaerae bacterium]